MHFWERSRCLLSAGAYILAFDGHSSANFQPILDCFIPNFKLKYDNSESVKNRSCKYTVVFNFVVCTLRIQRTSSKLITTQFVHQSGVGVMYILMAKEIGDD